MRRYPVVTWALSTVAPVACFIACAQAPATELQPAPRQVTVAEVASVAASPGASCEASKQSAIEARQAASKIERDLRRAMPPLFQGQASLAKIAGLEQELGNLEEAVTLLDKDLAKTKAPQVHEALARLAARLLEVRNDITSARSATADAFDGVEHAYVDSFGVPVQLARAAQLYDGACAEGDASSCVRKGELLENGVGLTKDLAAAAQAYNRACALNNPYGCYREGYLRFDGANEIRDPAAAVPALERGCEMGEGRSCFLLGKSLDSGRGGQQDATRAAEMYQRACVNEVTQACVALALQRQEGRGIPRNLDQAVNLLELACDAGDPFGCSQLGEVIYSGTGVAVDQARGKALLDRGCAGGDAWACKRSRELRAQ